MREAYKDTEEGLSWQAQWPQDGRSLAHGAESQKNRMRKAVMGRVLGDSTSTVGLLSLDFIRSVLDNP